MIKQQIQDFIIEGRESSKRPVFGFTGEHLGAYLDWAFSRNYLLLSSDENGINGVAVAYPLPEPYDGDLVKLLPYDTEIKEETDKDLCVLDWFATTVEGRISLVSQFIRRFPNWESQNKYGMQHGRVKKLSEKYIKLLTLKY
jgi:hypothetical protein